RRDDGGGRCRPLVLVDQRRADRRLHRVGACGAGRGRRRPDRPPAPRGRGPPRPWPDQRDLPHVRQPPALGLAAAPTARRPGLRAGARTRGRRGTGHPVRGGGPASGRPRGDLHPRRGNDPARVPASRAAARAPHGRPLRPPVRRAARLRARRVPVRPRGDAEERTEAARGGLRGALHGPRRADPRRPEGSDPRAAARGVTLPYWLDEPAPPVPDVRVERPDAVVVGGGITGCSCALALARAGLRVRLHEAREIGGGASGRNGGFALRGGAAPYDVTAASVGRDAAGWLWRETEGALDRIEAIAGDAFRRTGSLRLAADEEERVALQAEHDALRADGFEVEWVDELDPRVSRLFAGAILHPPDAAVHPGRLVRRLAVRAGEAGVEIRQRSRVES